MTFAEEMKFEDLQECIAKGKIVGKAEGKVEGRAEGKVEGRAEGKVEGKAEGFEEGKYQVATEALKDGIPFSTVVKITGLEPEEVTLMQMKLRTKGLDL